MAERLMMTIGLVGGTFDFFHIGHQKLIDTGLSHCQSLEIWVVSDEIAQKKDSRIKSWEERCEYLKSQLSLADNSRVSFHKLLDDYGAAIYHENASLILCTEETLSNCILINSIRSKNGLAELSIIEVPYVYSEDGNTVSSTRIRDGEIDINGDIWFNDKVLTPDIYLSKEAEKSLKDPFGILFKGPESDHSVAIQAALNSLADDHLPIIAVGDVTVKSLQDIDGNTCIGLIDEKTKRMHWDGFKDINQSLYDNVIECRNPQGMLTKSLFESCKFAIERWTLNNEKTLIVVDGEEDLSPLFLHILAPLNSVILYGQPNQGVVLRITSLESKTRCRKLLSMFDEK
tara:strand:- start:1694 stop:2725 length:1032 start_codon:yes stop_codon:yes gene_type:complete